MSVKLSKSERHLSTAAPPLSSAVRGDWVFHTHPHRYRVVNQSTDQSTDYAGRARDRRSAGPGKEVGTIGLVSWAGASLSLWVSRGKRRVKRMYSSMGKKELPTHLVAGATPKSYRLAVVRLTHRPRLMLARYARARTASPGRDSLGSTQPRVQLTGANTTRAFLQHWGSNSDKLTSNILPGNAAPTCRHSRT